MTEKPKPLTMTLFLSFKILKVSIVSSFGFRAADFSDNQKLCLIADFDYCT